MADSFRMDTSGNKAHREAILEDTADLFGERTKSGGVLAACDFSQQMLRNLERAVEHPDMTPELAEVLSTTWVDVEYRVETGVQVTE